MTGIDVYERRIGNFQLVIPILHEDGDMVDIYIQDSPLGEGYIRVCDFGLTLMRLSYTFDVAKPTRQSGSWKASSSRTMSTNNNGNLYLDTHLSTCFMRAFFNLRAVHKKCATCATGAGKRSAARSTMT